MEENNIQIVRECMEQVVNAKQLDRIPDFYSDQCVFRNPPYVGLGLFPDDSSGDQLVIKSVAAGGPAWGKVKVGDVLLRAVDAIGTWETYEQLRIGLWGQSKLGSEVTLTLLRNGETLEVTLARGQVVGFDNTMADVRSVWTHFFTAEMPDLHTEITQILASGDLVAYFAINSGTSAVYHQSAVWTECSILRLEDGKIVEWWGVEDTLSQWRQLGFWIMPPESRRTG